MVNYIPREDQLDCLQNFWNYLTNRDGNPVMIVPTGGGKSVIIAFACDELSKVDRRALILAPKKELVAQNVEKFEAISGSEKSGVYCAGLNRKEADADFLFGTIQSCYKAATEIGFRHVVFIDEAHLVRPGDDGMFNFLISQLQVINPKIRIVGLTATAYRLDNGMIYGKHPDLMFDDVCHETKIPDLLSKGLLSPIKAISVPEVDMSSVRVVRGEFEHRSMEMVFSADIGRAVAETVQAANQQGAKSCLVFGCSIDHCEAIADEIARFSGEECMVVTGETPSLLRENTLTRFKNGDLRWLVNCDVLTTGFDSPRTDLLSVMRSTMSPGLFAQMAGRALRTFEGKECAYLLDFGGNLKRHGALDSDDYGKISTRKQAASIAKDDDPQSVKECATCKQSVFKTDKICIHCGAELTVAREPNHDDVADSTSVALECVSKPLARPLLVERTEYSLHTKRGASPTDPRTLRVDYYCRKKGDIAVERHSEWVCLEHEGFARQKAVLWWSNRSGEPAPSMVETAVKMAEQGLLASPVAIEIKRDGKYDRVVSYILGPIPESDSGYEDSQEVLPF